jgi:hypothetical protein
VRKPKLRPEPEKLPAFQYEKKLIRRIFFRALLRSTTVMLFIVLEMVAFAIGSFIFLLPTVWGIVFLVPPAVTSTYGENRFFSRKYVFALRGRKSQLWVLLSIVAVLLSLLVPFRTPNVTPGLLSSVFYFASLSGLSGVWLFRQLGGFNRVEVDAPKWVTAGYEKGSRWAVLNVELMKKNAGLTIAIRNRSNTPLVLTMVWLEWFAYIRVPIAFHRELALVGSYNRIYRNERIELQKEIIVRPNDAATRVLTWQQVNSFHRKLLADELVDSRFITMIRFSAYDEYADRIYSSTQLPFQSIEAQEYFMRTGFYAEA